jgi:hypothetical protein
MTFSMLMSRYTFKHCSRFQVLVTPMQH